MYSSTFCCKLFVICLPQIIVIMEEAEAGLDSLEDREKLISLKLENCYSDHEEQLRSLVSSWTELKPDVCLITEVS